MFKKVRKVFQTALIAALLVGIITSVMAANGTIDFTYVGVGFFSTFCVVGVCLSVFMQYPLHRKD